MLIVFIHKSLGEPLRLGAFVAKIGIELMKNIENCHPDIHSLFVTFI